MRGAQTFADLICKHSDRLLKCQREGGIMLQSCAAQHGMAHAWALSLYCLVHLSWAVDRNGLG